MSFKSVPNLTIAVKSSSSTPLIIVDSAWMNIFNSLYLRRSTLIFLYIALILFWGRSLTFNVTDCSFCCWTVVLPCSRSLSIPGGKTYLPSFCSILTTPTSKSFNSSCSSGWSGVIAGSRVLVYLLQSPLTKSNSPKRRTTGILKLVINILINRMLLKSDILFIGVPLLTGILNWYHFAVWDSPLSNVTWVSFWSTM